MTLYCYLDSHHAIDSTNLQLYSLKQAALCWNELASDLAKYEESEIEDLQERLVFIANCLGLSISQLLGQNWPSENKDKMDYPGDLLSYILNCSHFSRDKKSRLNRGFHNDLLPTYNAIRHFGRVKNDANYKLIEDLDLAKVKRLKKLTVDIWDATIDVQRSNDLNNIDQDLASVADIIHFDEMPEPVAGPDV